MKEEKNLHPYGPGLLLVTVNKPLRVYTIASLVMLCVNHLLRSELRSGRSTHGHEWNINSPWLDHFFSARLKRSVSLKPVQHSLIQMHMNPASFSLSLVLWLSFLLKVQLTVPPGSALLLQRTNSPF